MTARQPVHDAETIIARIPMFIEGYLIIQVPISPATTAKSLCRQLGIHPPSLLCKWPSQVPFQPDENICEAIARGFSPYIRSIETQSLGDSNPGPNAAKP